MPASKLLQHLKLWDCSQDKCSLPKAGLMKGRDRKWLWEPPKFRNAQGRMVLRSTEGAEGPFSWSHLFLLLGLPSLVVTPWFPESSGD